MGYEDNEQEIDIVAMLFDALYKWRSILLAGLIGALLLGAYKYWSVTKGAAELEKAIAEGTVVEDDFDKGYLKAKSEMETKETDRRTQNKKSVDLQIQINEANSTITERKANIEVQKSSIDLYNDQIENTQALIDETQKYLNTSVLMQSADGIWTGRAVYRLIMDEEDPAAYRDPADQIVTSYQKPLAGSDEMSALAGKYGLETYLLDELYSVKADLDANTVIVTSYGNDKTMAEDILSAVCALVEKQDKAVSVAHQLEKGNAEFSVTKDDGLIQKKNATVKQLTENQNSLNQAKMAMAAANADIEKSEMTIQTAEASISDLEGEKELCDEKVYLLSNEIAKMTEKMPSMVPGTASKIKSSIKWAILGFVAGCAVLFFVYVVLYVIRPRLRMPDDIRTAYGYPIIGVLNKKVPEKPCAIDQWIMKAEGRGKRPGDDEIIRTIAVTIANTAQEGNRIALLSTLKGGKNLEILSEQISGIVPSMSFVTLTEGVTKAANVDELSRCDAVVLVEERNETIMEKLDADINQARLFNKKVLGAIVL